MNDTDREAEIRERVQFDGVHPAWYFEDIPFLLSALEREREARQELQKAGMDAVLALVDLGACDQGDCTEPNCLRALPRLRALITTEDSNKTQEETR